MFRLALAVHIVAEARVLDATTLTVVTHPPDALRWVVAQVHAEHAIQQAAADDLVRLVPGTASWYDRALKLRIDVLDHATREDLMRASFEDHIPGDDRQLLASRFATERLLVLSSASPINMARRIRAA